MQHPPVFFCYILLALVSCNAPGSYEQFVRADQATDGSYVFSLVFADTTATYDISLYTRVDAGFMASEQARELELFVRWGEDMAETVWLPCGRGGSVHLYRSGLRPVGKRSCGSQSPTAESPVSGSLVAGEYMLSIEPVNPPAGLRGIGVVLKRNR